MSTSSKNEWIALFITRDDYRLLEEWQKLSAAWEEAMKPRSFLISSVKCTKDLVEHYFLKEKFWWADITVNTNGVVNIQSDYGDYHYRWTSFGDDIKKFLIDCDYSYLYGKFGINIPRIFNQQETIKRIRKDILRFRREEGQFNSKSCREFWDATESLEKEYFPSTPEWGKALENTEIPKMYDYDLSSMPCVMDENPQLKEFLKTIWPEFIKILKNEMGYE